MSSHKSDQDIQRAAKNLNVDERWLRDLLETPDRAEFMERAANLALSGRGADAVARNLGIDEEEFRRLVARTYEEAQRTAAWRARQQEEERKNVWPSWWEDPPS